jgi:predicted phage terminase large subunit-like protein
MLANDFDPAAMPGSEFVDHFTQALIESELLCLLEAEAIIQSERSLYTFTKYVWPIVEPGREFIDNWHIGAICEHLQAVTWMQIQNLLINIPPRHMKSTLVDVIWPVWTWIQKFDDTGMPKSFRAGPQVKFLTGAHNEALATRDAVASRNLIMNHQFQVGFGRRFTMQKDQNQKHRYENNYKGYRLAFGMKTGVTGEGGDIVVVDDPHSVMEGMFSEVEREKALNTWDQQLANRLNDPVKGGRVGVMQRLHAKDWAGHVLEQMNWVHLKIPQEFSSKSRCVTILGWQDPRTYDGELLWEARFPKHIIEQEKKRLGPAGYAGQQQQEPFIEGGGIVPVESFKYAPYPPGDFVEWAHNYFVQIVQFWDTAQKDKEINDPWAGGTWGIAPNGTRWLLDICHQRMTYPIGKQTVIDYHNKWRPHGIVIEDKSTGSSLIQELTNPPDPRPGQPRVTALPVIPFEPEQDKLTRMSVESPAIAAGMVYLMDGAPWLFDFKTECQHFPNGDHDDRVDMLSMALKYFRLNEMAVPVVGPGGDESSSYWRR